MLLGSGGLVCVRRLADGAREISSSPSSKAPRGRDIFAQSRRRRSYSEYERGVIEVGCYEVLFERLPHQDTLMHGHDELGVVALGKKSVYFRSCHYITVFKIMLQR